jgi:hypothetical protein
VTKTCENQPKGKKIKAVLFCVTISWVSVYGHLTPLFWARLNIIVQRAYCSHNGDGETEIKGVPWYSLYHHIYPLRA